MTRRLDWLDSAPVIPVLVIEQVAHAVPLARALVAGGLPNLEVTLRTDAALDAIAAIARDVPDARVGVGTVRNPADVQRAHDAGAVFAVSPGLPPSLRDADLPMDLLPGAMTPTEIMAAAEAGFDALKLFPAAVAGGEAMLRAIAGPLPELRFCPTGGVREDTLRRYLALPNVACVGGTWLADRETLERGDWAHVETLARRAVAIAHDQPTSATGHGGPRPQVGEEDPGSAVEAGRP